MRPNDTGVLVECLHCKSILVDTVFPEIFELSGAGKVPDNSRALARTATNA